MHNSLIMIIFVRAFRLKGLLHIPEGVHIIFTDEGAGFVQDIDVIIIFCHYQNVVAVSSSVALAAWQWPLLSYSDVERACESIDRNGATSQILRRGKKYMCGKKKRYTKTLIFNLGPTVRKEECHVCCHYKYERFASRKRIY